MSSRIVTLIWPLSEGRCLEAQSRQHQPDLGRGREDKDIETRHSLYAYPWVSVECPGRAHRTWRGT